LEKVLHPFLQVGEMRVLVRQQMVVSLIELVDISHHEFLEFFPNPAKLQFPTKHIDNWET